MPWTVADVDEHKKGLTAEQKQQWVRVANSILSKCIADGGTDTTCAPQAIRQANGVVNHKDMETNNFTIHSTSSGVYQTRTKTYRGRKHIIVPIS